MQVLVPFKSLVKFVVPTCLIAMILVMTVVSHGEPSPTSSSPTPTTACVPETQRS